MTNEQAFEKIGNEIAEIALIAIKKELMLQGHNMTGNLLESIKYEVKAEALKVIIQYSMFDYGMIQNYGVKPDEIKKPFARPRIEGLKRFVELRMGKRGKEAESIAFAIARKHKDEGMPTDASKKYSKTGKRTNWIGDGLKEANPKIIEIVNKIYTEVINVVVINAFVDFTKKDSKNIKVTIR